MFHMRKLYQDLLTYHNYIAPQFAEKEDVKKDDFLARVEIAGEAETEARILNLWPHDCWANPPGGQGILLPPILH